MAYDKHVCTKENVQNQRELENISPKRYDGYHKYDHQVACTYDSSREVERHWHKEDQFVKDYFRNKRINSLLDIPVGTGRFFPHYSSVGSFIGVDISEAMLLEARKKTQMLSSGVLFRLELGDVFSLSYADMEFDMAIVFRLFHLIPESLLNQAIRELCRVVRNNLIVQTYVPLSLHGYWLSKYNVGLKKMLSMFKRCGTPPLLTTALNPPWLDIEAFYHNQALYNSIFRTYGFYPSDSRLLDIYGNCEVRATVYTRKI